MEPLPLGRVLSEHERRRRFVEDTLTIVYAFDGNLFLAPATRP